MGGACGAYGERRGVYRILVGKPGGKSHWRDPGVNERIILRCIFIKWDFGGMDWIDLAQDKERWRALVNAGMNLRVP